LIEEENVITAAFVTVEIEGLKSPTDPAVSSCAHQGLEDRILSRNKANCCVQHLSAWKTAAKKSALAALP
jgi:hypothetical protein